VGSLGSQSLKSDFLNFCLELVLNVFKEFISELVFKRDYEKNGFLIVF